MMIKKIKIYLYMIIPTLMLAVPVMVPAVAGATGGCTSNIANQITQGATSASGNDVSCGAVTDSTSGIATLAGHIVNIFSIIVGIVAVIMIIYGGFRYITSGGDSNSVGSAKNTLIYAIIGLIIVALAQIIVHFVLSTTNSVSGT